MENSNQGSLCKYPSKTNRESPNLNIKLTDDQSRTLTELFDGNDNIFTINYNVNIGPNVNLKIPQKKIIPTKEEKEFFKSKLKVKKKTELCKSWELYKNCYFKDQCSFAHGETELRHKPIKQNPRYKTKPCKALFEKMYCAFGSRCQYSHRKSKISFSENLNRFSEHLYNMLLQNEHSDSFNLSKTLGSCQNLFIFKR
jgi:hypothetical protein